MGCNTKLTISAMLLISWGVPAIVIVIPLLTDFGDIGYDHNKIQLVHACGWVTSNPSSTEYNNIVL